MVEFLPSKQAVAGSSPVSRSFPSTVYLDGPGKPPDGKQAVVPFRGDGFFMCQKAFNEHLPCFLANTCLAFHFLTKVFTNSPRQVVSNWNCFWSNYRPSLGKKQVRQVFYREGMTTISLLLSDTNSFFKEGLSCTKFFSNVVKIGNGISNA